MDGWMDGWMVFCILQYIKSLECSVKNHSLTNVFYYIQIFAQKITNLKIIKTIILHYNLHDHRNIFLEKYIIFSPV